MLYFGDVKAQLFTHRKIMPGPEPTSCWIWTGYKVEAGYGRLSLKGKVTRVHRASYIYFKGPILEGLEIDHLCAVRACFNPEHLEAVTRSENSFRGKSYWLMKDVCKKGHPFDTYRLVSGCRVRACSICRHKSERKQMLKRRALRKNCCEKMVTDLGPPIGRN